jgi:2-polyprenyl-6-hydroxyphenyl methylase/3-demethylubiquinone-9 3-methyltransferase
VLKENTIGGLHNFLVDTVLPRHIVPGGLALDLGAGSGALASRVLHMGMKVIGVDIQPENKRATDIPFVVLDLSRPFDTVLPRQYFDLVISVEVIEHVQNPIGFLGGISTVLKPGGKAIITTPNVDNLPARIKFLLRGKLRMMDEYSNPEHISPIFLDLFQRQYLPLARLKLLEHTLYPADGYLVTRPKYALPLRLLAGLLHTPELLGDNHVFVLEPMSGLSVC